jgi:phosphate:Na+ symporter
MTSHPAQQPSSSTPSAALRTGIGITLLAIAFCAFAAGSEPVPESPDWLQLGLGLFGGLALFLAGLQQLSEGMTKAAGQALKQVLGTLTKNRFTGAITGALVTGILNSSTVTTLLVVGFVSGGMMTLAQSVGVIMGANVGSTVTAQLLAFDLSAYSLGPVAVGFFMLFTAKREKVKYYGMMIMGLGLVFYGMGLISDAMKPLREFEPFLDILKSLERPIAGIIAGAVFTAVVQSSAATVGIAIAMASEGLLSLPAGIALALGANIGSAATTALMGILSAKSTDAVRTAMVHVTFNVLGVLLWLPLIWLLVDIAVWLSPSSPELTGQARAAAEVPRQIANANTFFNIINTLIFIGFAGWFARFSEWLIKDRATPEGVIIEPKYLDESALVAPSLALQQVRLELGRVGKIVIEMLETLVPALDGRSLEALDNVARRDDEVDILEAAIISYLAKLRSGTLTDQESTEFQILMSATDNFESLADVIETDLVDLARKAVALGSTRSGTETRAMLRQLYATIVEAVEQTVQAVSANDQRAAESVMLLKDNVRIQSENLLARKAERLTVDVDDYLELVRLEMSFVDQMRRIYTLTKRVCKDILPAVLAERD